MNAIVDVSCPKCGGAMELLTVPMRPPEARMWKCASCAGMWLDRRACELLVGGELPDAPRDFIRSAAPGNATSRSREGYREAPNASREGLCPDCHEPLASYVTDEKTHGTRVALDVCRDHGTYFDRGEARTLLTAIEMKRLTVSVEDEANRASESWSHRERMWNGLLAAIFGPVVVAGAVLGVAGGVAASSVASGSTKPNG